MPVSRGEVSAMKFMSCSAVLLILLSLAASAQEGYPLDGTWRGEWGQPGGEMTMAVVVMNWDGEAISGRINPGRNMTFFEQASLDPDTWTVRFTSTSKAGEPIVFEGVLENIGSYNRIISGTWTIAGVDNALTLTRE